ncbi:expressed unknown protein [Seminavis robusta]|uniref:CRAL-TRIO domain-containing protein n=1 Tax=Seminavis robusta TaxID=568900 RepID=A0A9N8DT47_9STRA|nr:expressed unknown protein [Seminavis robusta]|eukprot:Sro232_g093920.1 n/a (165) ;mRNA; r:47556-48146
MNLFKSHDSIRGVMQRTYYLSQLLCPDLKAVQAGTTSLLECEGYSFQVSMVFDRHVIRSVASGAWNVYPIKHRAVRFFNTSILFNAMISTIKPALREEFRSKIRVGCKFPCGRLDRIYNIPSEEVAVARLCQKLEELIRRRFDNERNFSLEDAFVETDSSGDVE